MTQEEMQTAKRDHFTFFRSFQEAIDQCQEKEQLALYKAIVNYALDGEEPTFENNLLRLAWTLIKPNLLNGWVRSRNGRKAEGVSKPGMKGNKNASKTKPNQSQNEAKTKLNQSNRIGKDRIGMANVSIETKEDIEETTAGPSVSLSSDYQNFIDWLNKNCTHLLKMNIPTEEEYQKLMEAADQSKKILTGKLLAMENNKDVPKTKRSIYRTCLEWLKRDKR